MGNLVYILGRSGSGKSYSLNNFPPDKLAVINVQGKILPFRNSGKIKTIKTDESKTIVKQLETLAKSYKDIVIDDFQYVMANEFMRRSTERGYDKFTEIARHAWDIANVVSELPQDVIVYVMCHLDRAEDGTEKIKTIGKLLDEKICLEGMSTIVLKTCVIDGHYYFLTQNNGSDTTKSPAGMFPSYAIENDLYYVSQKIRNYYGFDGAPSDEVMAEQTTPPQRQTLNRRTRRKRRDEGGRKMPMAPINQQRPHHPPTNPVPPKGGSDVQKSKKKQIVINLNLTIQMPNQLQIPEAAGGLVKQSWTLREKP